MRPEALWQAISTAPLDEAEGRRMGRDLYFAAPWQKASGAARKASDHMARILGIRAEAIWRSLTSVPYSIGTLERMGRAALARVPYERLSAELKAKIADVAATLPPPETHRKIAVAEIRAVASRKAKGIATRKETERAALLAQKHGLPKTAAALLETPPSTTLAEPWDGPRLDGIALPLLILLGGFAGAHALGRAVRRRAAL